VAGWKHAGANPQDASIQSHLDHFAARQCLAGGALQCSKMIQNSGSKNVRKRFVRLRALCRRNGLLAMLAASGLLQLPVLAASDLWTTGYYPGYRQSYLAPSDIDFAALSHVIHFSLRPNSDGSLNTAANGITASASADLVTQAHAADRKALICVGGAGSQSGFQGATMSSNLPVLISNLTSFVSLNRYDGVDLDWEPLPASDFKQYTNLVNGLRAALDGFASRKLLSAAVAAYPVYGDPPDSEAILFASLQGQFDQINVMTYDMAGPYSGWVTWFNSPLFDAGCRFPSTGGSVPSLDASVSKFLSNGMAPGKLGIGIAFYGNVWAGGTGTATGGAALPRQSWVTAPSVAQIAYFDIMSTYFQSNLYHWDGPAQAAYLSIDNPGSVNDKFISYDDEHTCQAKVSYVRKRSLGGLIIWELGQGYWASQSAGQRNPLLQAIKQAVAAPP